MEILNSRYISRPAVFYLAVVVLSVLFFELWRAGAMFRQWELARLVPTGVLLESFLVGARFDVAVASFLIMPIYLIGVIPGIEITRRRISRWVTFALITVTVGVMFVLHMADLEFFAYFNSRLNGMALSWQGTPDMMWSMIWGMFPVIRYLLLLVAVMALYIWSLAWLQRRLVVRLGPSSVLTNLIWLPVVLGLLFIGIRGRVQEKSPVRTGVAYFSPYLFANQLALNPAYTFWRDAFYDARDREQLDAMFDRIVCPDREAIVSNLLGLPDGYENLAGGKIVRPVRVPEPNPDPPNLILVMMESFGATKLGALDNRYPFDLSPRFDSLTQEGVLFTRFYSSGMHTYTGLMSALTGCPHQCTELIMKGVAGQEHFWSLAHMVRKHGYHTLFFLTHDPHFDNMHGFVAANGMDRTISSMDYPRSEYLGTWGVPDHVMFDRAVEDLRAMGSERYFALLLTTSNHGPWLVPDVPFERIPDTVNKAEELNAFKYTDWALGRFIRAVQADTSFRNTIIMVTADNGTPYLPTLDMDLTQYHMPLLILDSDHRLPAGRRIDRLGGQYDIPATAMGLLGLDYDNYTFGHDLLDTASGYTNYAHFAEWFKVGYIEGDLYLIHRLRGGPNSLFHVDDVSVNLADSLPELTREYEQKALALFKTGYLNQQLPLPDSLRLQKLVPHLARAEQR